jgi:tetratricopeptide (TPR) repeat protein
MEEQPLVLIVDDYPRSDEASLSVLHMLLRRATNERLMVVLAGRPPEPDEPAQAVRIRKAVSYLPMQRIELAPMSEGDSEELIAGLLSNVKSKPGSPERRAILRTAGGNPMAVELLVHDWKKHGQAALAVLLPAMGEVPGSAMEAIGYDRLIDSILPSLSTKTRLALYLAAVLGPRLNDLEFFEIVELTPARTMAALSELIRGSVLRNTGAGLEFVNELLRARLYLRIPNSARTRLHSSVADRLLSASRNSGSAKGLEVAWHCMRAGRSNAAISHLMTGARTAIGHGAPDEGARALASALGQLKGRNKTAATLLLAETYHEMGAWKDALESIARISHDDLCNDHDLQEMEHVLRLTSELNLSVFPASKLEAIVTEFLNGSSSYGNQNARALAILEAAYLAGALRNDDVLSQVRDSVRSLSQEQLEPSNARRVLVAAAVLDYHLRSTSSGLHALASAVKLSEFTGTMDSTFAQIQTGWGALASAQGRYVEAFERGEAAYKAASRLDNMPLIAQAASNISLCCYRLGRMQESLKWASIAWDNHQPGNPSNYVRVQASARCAMVHAELGNERACRKWLDTLKEVGRSSELNWVIQAAKLFEADVLWLLDERDLALSLIQTMDVDSRASVAVGFIGPMARWTAVSAATTGNTSEALRLLRHWFDQLETLDMLDRVEVLCGLAQVEKESVRLDLQSRAGKLLSELPTECSRQLKRLSLRLPN